MNVQQEREPLILSVDTTTDVRSVAVVFGGHTRAQRAGELRGAQAANLLGEIDGVLREACVRLCDVDLFAVATGPGSFTGLRAGLATIKAFAETFDKPVVGVPTLHAVACAAGARPHIVAALPAGRGELFAQLIGRAPDGSVEELSVPAHLPPALLVERAQSWPTPLLWAGAGAHVQADVLRAAAERAGLLWRVESDKAAATGAGVEEDGRAEKSLAEDSLAKDSLSEAQRRRAWVLARPGGPYAAEVAALAVRAYKAGRASSAAELRALYVRLSDAELNERCRV